MRRRQSDKVRTWEDRKTRRRGGGKALTFSPALPFARAGAVRFFLVPLLLLPISLLASCRKQEQRAAQKTHEEKPPIVANVSLDKSTITIGEKIRYTITVEANKDIEFKLPEYGENLAEFAIQDFGTEEPKKTSDGRVIQKRWYVLDTYMSGPYIIPPATIRYKLPNGTEEKEIKTTKLFVEVKGPEEGEVGGDIRDIAEPVDIPPDYSRYYLWGGVSLGALLLITCGGIAFYILRRGGPIFAAPPRPAHEVAYEELQRLLDDDLISKGRIKEFYFRLSDVTRRYIENRFQLMAPERTTEEFLIEMSTTDLLEDGHKKLVAQFLEHCDLVKFAKYGPSREEIEEAYASAKRLIDETRETAEEEYEGEEEEE